MSSTVTERPPSSSSTSSSISLSSSIGRRERDVDPLLKDLSEKKQSFRRNLVLMAAELKEVRGRLASQEQSFARETLTRRACSSLWLCVYNCICIYREVEKKWLCFLVLLCVECGVVGCMIMEKVWIFKLGFAYLKEAETKARKMEEEVSRLQKNLEERNGQLQASSSYATTYLNELEDLRSELSTARAIADASATSAESSQFQCLALLNELDEKNSSLKQHETRINKLSEQLDHLQKDLQARESSQKQLKDEVLRIEHDIMQALAKAGSNTDCELKKILDEISPKNFERINKLLIAKDEEIAKLRDEIRIISAQWRLKTKELESQLEKHRRTDQELKKRVLKLEFCLQEARSQTRKLQRMGKRRDKALKELRDQLATKQQGGPMNTEKQNFWETSGFKIVVSTTMLILLWGYLFKDLEPSLVYLMSNPC